ncbi:GxxExxY protein [Aequorivita lipolytica]|uniref:GxxExxY protein n=1 Tax=Aequorivita lipolytica TaxID=153267 RepID=A0A5C6YP64_9FLAO|nr:GxxExxY protein [Aequorivita lipolytica]TXD68824.1 GxxExxY protein [Aequorivita lipolytica]
MTDIIYRQESYDVVGCLYEVFNCLGSGLSEIVYKDALKYEFIQRNISFEREKEFSVPYKDIILKHKFYADFVVYDKIILEIKTVEILTDLHLGQCINYLKVSKNKLAILANFKGEGLEYKRVVL